MSSLLVLSSLVYPVTFLGKRISAVSRRVMSCQVYLGNKFYVSESAQCFDLSPNSVCRQAVLKAVMKSRRRYEQRRKYSKVDKRAKDKLVRSPGENGGG